MSPWFIVLFLLLPGSLILSRVFHFHLAFSITTNMLVGNNICLLAALAARLLRYLARLRCGIRYGADPATRVEVLEVGRGADRVRADLTGAGYQFDAAGSYGEKRDIGYLGTTLVYGGLVLLLATGVWDNLRQFSGTVIKGPGAPFDLSREDKYFNLITGPLSSLSGFPLLKVTKQVFPGKEYPLGATGISLYSRDGKKVGEGFIDAAKGPYRFGGYDIYLARLLADFALTVKTRGSLENNVFDDAVKVFPLYDKKVGDFSLYGTFATPAGDDGEAYLDPINDIFRISLSRTGKKLFETDFKFQGGYRDKEEGNYVVSILGMGQWSEIHVVRRRHMDLIWAGAIITVLGLLLRTFIGSQRVWLEETAEGCRVRFVGGEDVKRLRTED
jgi:hypothetical protein